MRFTIIFDHRKGSMLFISSLNIPIKKCYNNVCYINSTQIDFLNLKFAKEIPVNITKHGVILLEIKDQF